MSHIRVYYTLSRLSRRGFVNPLSPSLTVRGLQVKERSGDVEFVAFDELYVNLAWSSLLKLRQG